MQINDNHQSLNIVRCICFECRHFDVSLIECPAFGDEIPESILSGKRTHTNPLLGQKNKIVFEQLNKG